MSVSYAVCRGCPRLRAKVYPSTGMALGCDQWISDGSRPPPDPDPVTVSRMETCVVMESCDRFGDYEAIRMLREL